MSTVVIRNRKKPSGPLFNLSDEARERAKKHLKEVAGIDVEKLPHLIWPDDAVSAYQEHTYAPWKFTTKDDIKRKRQENAKRVLYWKRDSGIIRRKPVYVWVFWVPGWLFGGWWTYLIGRGVEHGGKYQTNSDLILQAMKMFPVVESTLFDVEEGWKEREKWMIAFAKRYQRGARAGKPQGKAPIWAEIQGNQIIRLLDRAEWPENLQINSIESKGA